MVISFTGVSRNPDLLVTVVRCCGDFRFALKFIRWSFQIYLSLRHIAQQVTQGKTLKIAKSVLCKIIASKDIVLSSFECPQSITKF